MLMKVLHFLTMFNKIPSSVRWATVGILGTLFVSGGAVAVHSAYVHESTCRDYEDQVFDLLDESMVYAKRALRVANSIESNPFLAFSSMGEMLTIASEIDKLESDSDSVRRDFEEYCGAQRVNSFLSSEEVTENLDELDRIADILQNL